MAINKTAAGTYCVDFRDQHGKRIRKTFDRLEDARAYDKQSLGDISKGDFVAPSDVTVKEIAEAWHKRKVDTAGYRPATLGNWRTHIDRYIAPTLGNLAVQRCGIEQVENAAAEWGRMTSSNTANKVLTTWAAVFKLAQRYGPLQGKANPAELAERVKIPNDEEKDDQVTPECVYTQDELKKLINATAAGSLERVLVMVPALCGLRIGEVLGLQWPAIDLKANKLHVRTNLVDIGKKNGGRGLRAPKSISSRRTLDLPQELARELKFWKLACPPSEQDLVFATIEGKPLHRKFASQILDAAITAAEVKRLTLHKLRHSFASLYCSRATCRSRKLAGF
ncbi:MAG TPA: site-specific integrase [Candidatus Binatia bacterium]